MTRILCAIFLLALAIPAAAQDKIEKGKQVYTAQKCQVCHDVGVKLKEDELRQWITAAPEMAAKAKVDRKPPMKAYPNLPKEDLDALVAYLSSLKKKA